jgi:hypothetical protein
VIAATHGDHAVLGDQPLHDRHGALGQALGIADHHLDLAAQDAACGVDVFLGDQHRVAHRFAADDGAGGGQRRQRADLDRAETSCAVAVPAPSANALVAAIRAVFRVEWVICGLSLSAGPASSPVPFH